MILLPNTVDDGNDNCFMPKTFPTSNTDLLLDEINESLSGRSVTTISATLASSKHFLFQAPLVPAERSASFLMCRTISPQAHFDRRRTSTQSSRLLPSETNSIRLVTVCDGIQSDRPQSRITHESRINARSTVFVIHDCAQSRL